MPRISLDIMETKDERERFDTGWVAMRGSNSKV